MLKEKESERRDRTAARPATCEPKIQYRYRFPESKDSNAWQIGCWLSGENQPQVDNGKKSAQERNDPSGSIDQVGHSDCFAKVIGRAPSRATLQYHLPAGAIHFHLITSATEGVLLGFRLISLQPPIRARSGRRKWSAGQHNSPTGDQRMNSHHRMGFFLFKDPLFHAQFLRPTTIRHGWLSAHHCGTQQVLGEAHNSIANRVRHANGRADTRRQMEFGGISDGSFTSE